MTTANPAAQLVCVEIGGGGVETVLLDAHGTATRYDGLAVPHGLPLLIAVPGIIVDGRVIVASNLGWYDVDPATQLGLPAPAAVVGNDAETAALGESVLRGGVDLVFLGLGTGVGGAVVLNGAATCNLFAHHPGFSDRACPCGRTGCLETVAAGWALPDPLTVEDLPAVARALAQAVEAEPSAVPELVVLCGGLTARHPALVGLLAAELPHRTVEATAAPGTKSAAAWGLRHLLLSRTLA
ncbi:MAG TPA: ROK family protein [Mycobacteriales bacterium]|nr:ROK family protein [Mycobacteriales bacterium]